MTKVCPKCNKINADSSKFCENCGEELTEVATTSSKSGGIGEWWNKQGSGAKAAILIAGLCCIGLIVIVGFVGMYSPDETTTSTSTSSVSTSTQSAGNITVLSSNPTRDSIGNYIVSGEVQNNYKTEKDYVKIVGTGYDSSGNVVSTGFTYANLETIPAGGTSPFKLYLDDENDEIVKYTLQAEA